jgi:hypothetical protein
MFVPGPLSAHSDRAVQSHRAADSARQRTSAALYPCLDRVRLHLA